MAISIPAEFRRSVAIVALLVIGVAGYSLVRQYRSAGEHQGVNWIASLQEVGASRIADRIGPGKRILLLLPSWEGKAAWAGLESLREGLTSKKLDIVGEELIESDPESDPMVTKIPLADYSALLSRHPGVDAVLSCAGVLDMASPVPAGVDPAHWPAFYLNAMTGLGADVQRQYDRGLLAGVLLPRAGGSPPRPPYEELVKMPSAQAFDILYELSTQRPPATDHP